jgi:hypothetical protein
MLVHLLRLEGGMSLKCVATSLVWLLLMYNSQAASST